MTTDIQGQEVGNLLQQKSASRHVAGHEVEKEGQEMNKMDK